MPSARAPPAPTSLIVNVSVALALASAIVTVENGFTGASEVVARPALVPVIVGATAGLVTAGSLSITEVVLSTLGVAPALLVSLSVNVVVEVVLGSPAFGLNVRASSSPVIAAAVPDSV